VELVCLNHTAIWADLSGLGKGGRDKFAYLSPSYLNLTSDRSSIATNARTTKVARRNRP